MCVRERECVCAHVCVCESVSAHVCACDRVHVYVYESVCMCV